ncbi:MAG: hypothetical protein QOF37_200 [Thermoleophilaceae bacterium]|nr:hypothetical protein [Thermoleophilaceae bacterium]
MPARASAVRAVGDVARSPWLAAGAVTLLAGVLRLYGLSLTRTAPYYDAAVRSMGESWHNFFYAAYEPGASVAIDKPPLDLWLQVISTKLFGMGPQALLLPEALAGTLAVLLLFDLVRRPFGAFAGFVAALTAAVLPVSVVTSRSDTMDSTMMMLTVLAAWLVLRAAEKGRARFLYAAALVAGLAFEVKLLEALIAVPALVVLYVLASREPRGRLLRHMAIAAAVYAVAALWWPLAVTLASGHKPYALGSTDGSVLNATFVFNGKDRIVGSPASIGTAPRGWRPGPLRLLDPGQSRYSQYVGGALVAAAILSALAVALSLSRRSRPRPSEESEARTRRALAWAVAAWLVPGVVVFSAMQQLHPRYLEAITPAVGAAVGISLASLLAAARRGRFEAFVLAVGVLASAAYLAWASSRGAGTAVTAVLAAGLAAIAFVIGGGARARWARALLAAGAALALVSMFVPPAARSIALVHHHSTDAGHIGDMPAARTTALSRYLAPRTRGVRYEVVSESFSKVAPLIVRDGRPVVIATGVKHRPLISLRRLRSDVTAGRVRYALFGDHCGKTSGRKLRRCPALARWLRAHGTEVSRQAGLPPGTLFRLKA